MLPVDAKMFACKQTDYIESGFPETFAYFFFPILFPALFCHKTRKNFNQEPISITHTTMFNSIEVERAHQVEPESAKALTLDEPGLVKITLELKLFTYKNWTL